LLTFLHAHWIAPTECVAVHGIDGICDFQIALVALAAQIGIPAVQREKDLGVVSARLLFRFNIEESELSRVRGSFHIPARMNVAVIPASSRGTGDERIPPDPTRRYHRRPFFLRTIHLGRNEQAMPMNQLRNFGLVEYLDCYRLPLAQPQDRAGAEPLYPVVLIVLRGATSSSTGEM